MFLDARSLPIDETIETDVCIVGAGPAGIVLAQELAGQGFRICLLESGGLEFSEHHQSLAEVETSGDRYPSPELISRRQFGGMANHWPVSVTGREESYVRYVPLDEIDFDRRDWVPYSGWPFTKSELIPHYERAQFICGLGKFAYDYRDWETQETPALKLASERVNTDMFQFGPRRVFTDDARRFVDSTDDVTVILYANVVEISTNQTATEVTHVRVVSSASRPFQVAAKLFVLAAGGIQNPRLLLMSRQVQTAGLGNQYDLVGRFFMDHPLARSGMFVPIDRSMIDSLALYDLRIVDGTPVMGHLTLSQDVLRRERLLNVNTLLFPRHARYGSKAVVSLESLLAMRRRANVPLGYALRHARNVIAGLDDIVVGVFRLIFGRQPIVSFLDRGGWSYLPDRQRRRYAKFEVFHITEQTPSPDNRVTLSNSRDALGYPMPHLHWRAIPSDVKAIERGVRILGKEIERAGLGHIEHELEGGYLPWYSPSASHYTGTTRMHVDPRQGVVDENSRVHNISNLFIAGCSVFPTCGAANPTLTLIALSVRLADHIKQIMSTSQSE